MEEILNQQYKPELAIVVYSKDQSEYYLESHSINEQGHIMEGKPLLQDTLNGIVDVFFNEAKDQSRVFGLIPDNVLYFETQPGGKYKLIWYRPAEIQNVIFARQLKIKSGRAWIPPMIYKVADGELFIWALKDKHRPTEATRLFKAPFHNTDDDGNVCLGSASIKKPAIATFTNVIKYWEDLFWKSEFSHGNGMEEATKSDLSEVWRKMIASKENLKWSDIDELESYGKKTFKSIL